MTYEVRWMVCDAPAGGCGGGPRRRLLVRVNAAGVAMCPHCSSQMRPAADTKRAVAGRRTARFQNR